MLRSQLNSYSGNDPIWGFVALVGSERFTGAAAVGLDPRVHLYSLDGRIYYAERDGDLPLSARLVNCGALTPTQLEYGAVDVGGAQSLARLFHRQPLVDRDAVELTIEGATDSLLESVANKPVGMPELFPLRHHPAGIHHWLRSVAVAVPHSDREEAAPTVEPAPTDVEVVETVAPEPVVVAPEPAPIAVEPEPDPVAVEERVEPAIVTPAPLLAPLSLQPLVPLTTPEPAAPEPQPVLAEPEPEPESEPEPEPAASDPLISRLAPLPSTSPLDVSALGGMLADFDDLSEMEGLPSLSSVAYLPSSSTDIEQPSAPTLPTAQPPSFMAPTFDTTSEPTAFAPDFSAAGPLPKLASAPIGVEELMASIPVDGGRTVGGQPHNLAAVEIWELVDHMLVDPAAGPTGVSTGNAGQHEASDDKRAGRGRLRGRKG